MNDFNAMRTRSLLADIELIKAGIRVNTSKMQSISDKIRNVNRKLDLNKNDGELVYEKRVLFQNLSTVVHAMHVHSKTFTRLRELRRGKCKLSKTQIMNFYHGALKCR